MNLFLRSLFFLLLISTRSLFVSGQCTVNAGRDTAVCVNTPLQLNASATGTPPPSVLWSSTPAGGISSGINTLTPTINTSVAQTYTLVLNGNSGQCLDTVKVTVNPLPAASFTFSPNNQCASTPVTFTNTSSGVGLTYFWDFNDPNSGANNTSNVTHPVHHFVGTTGIGTQNFIVTLIATSSSGCKDTVTSVVTIKQSPGTELGGTGQTTYNGLSYFKSCSTSSSANFTFTNQSSTAGTNVSYTIIWGDGSPNFTAATFSAPITHTYNIGTYTLQFIVTGAAPNSCVDTGTYYVFVGSNPAVGLNNPGNTTVCSGAPLTFPITGTGTNPPGTTYTVSFNDGSTPVILSHPPPASVTHSFTITSCGTTSSDGSNSYPNSFSAVIVASNPCGTSSSAVVPIYVSQKPVATFNITPKDTVCVNNTITFTNTSIGGNNNDNGQCTPPKLIWTITPSTGWNIVSGTMGNDFGLTDPSLWSSGSTVLQLNFTATGVYTIKLKVGSNLLCNYDSTEKTICVNSIPVAAFSLDQTIGCAPLNVAATNNSSLSNCGPNRYNWSVTYAPTAGCTPATSGYTYTNGTSSSSQNPQFQFTNPGVYTISLITIAPAAACSSQVVTAQVTVKSKPVVNITAPSSICQNQSINPTATSSCYVTSATYAWSFPGGTPSSSGSQIPGTITYNNTGAFNLSLDVTNECGTTNATQPININTVTASSAGPSQNVCGSTITMAGNTATIGTGQWTFVSGPNIPIINTPSSPTTTVSGLIPGTYVFTWTISNGSCTSSSNVTIVISPGPTPAAAGPDQGLCLATSVTMAANTPTIGTGQWSYISGPAGYTITNPSSPTTTITGLVPGVYIFRWTTSFSNCTPSTDNVQITIYDNPSPANAGNDQTICAASVTLSGNTPTIGTGQWSLISGPNIPFITTASSPTTTVTGLIAGTYSFRWKISNGNCPSNEDTVQVHVIAVPTTAVAGADQSLCAATSATLNGNTPLTGTGQWTYVSGPAGYTITNPALPNTSVTGLVPGVYIFKWTISNGICPPSSDNVQITVYDNATTSNAGPSQNVCGTSITMAGNTPLIGTGQWSYVSGPAGSVITNPSSPATTITGLVPGTYVFAWTISNGTCVSSSNVTIIISTGPTPAAAGPDQQHCLATSVTMAGNTPLIGTGQWSYVSGPVGSVITNPSSPNTTITGLVPGVYIFRWTTTFSNCTATNDDVQITIYDNPTASNAGADQVICVSTATLTANVPAIGTGSWSFINGPAVPVIVSPANNSTTVNGMTIGGVYSFQWTISNGNCPPSRDTVKITVTAIANNSISSNQQTCINTAASLITGSIPTGGNGAFTYQWQSSTNGGLTWNNIPGANAQDYDPGVLIQTTCFHRVVSTTLCSGPSSDISSPVCITVNPDAKATFTYTKDTACWPFVLSIQNTSPAVNNGTYNWYANGVLIGTGTAFPGYTLPLPSSSVIIKLVAISAFGCKNDSTSHSFYTKPKPVPAFTLSDTIGCGPLSVSFVNTTGMIDTFSYRWDFGNGQTSTLQQPGSIIFNTNPNFGDTVYTVKLYAFNECDTQVYQKNIRVQSKPKAAISPSSTIGCSPMHIVFNNNSQGLGITYYWDLGDGTKDTLFNNASITHTYNTGVIDTFTVTLIAVNHCGSDTQHVDIVVTPNTIQPAIVINGSELYGCAPHTVNFINNSLGASQLVWDFGDGSPAVTTPNNQVLVSHTYFTAGTFTILITLQNNCTDTSITKQVTVYTPPVASFILNKTLICTGDTIFTNNTSQNGNAYEWFWGDNTSTTGFNASHIYNFAGTYSVRLVVKRVNNFGVVCTDTSGATVVTVLNPIAAQIQIDPANRSCAPYVCNVSALNATGAANIQWVFYDSSLAPYYFYASGPAATHTYNSPGTYSVKLIVQNAAGCKDSITQIFTVFKKPSVSFTPLDAKTCNTDTTMNFAVTLNYSGTDPVNYYWFINGQNVGSGNPFAYHFIVPSGQQATSTFNIQVSAQNSAGCGDTANYGVLKIQTIKKPGITVSPSYVQEQPNYTFTFRDTVQTNPNKVYLWYTGDRSGQQLGGQEITYRYGDTGTYKVRLYVTDFQTGCSVSDSVQVTILYVPGYLYVPSAFCPGCNKAELQKFLPLGKGLKEYHLAIFNIWGQKVFETRSIDANGVPNEAWDGRWNGQPVQQDSYGWQIEAKYINGTEWKGMKYTGSDKYQKSGFITIIR